MSNPDIELKKLAQRVDRFAGRLNPGLAAIAVVLSTWLLAEITLRAPAYEDELASSLTSLSIDRAALSDIGVTPAE